MGSPMQAPIPVPVYQAGGVGVVPQHLYEIPVQGLARGGSGTATDPYTGWCADVAASPGCYFFSPHEYALDASVPLQLKAGTTLRGSGLAQTYLRGGSGYAGHGIQAIGAINSSTAGDIVIEHLAVSNSNATSNPNCKGIEIRGLSYCHVRHVQVSGWTRGIVFDQAEVTDLCFSRMEAANTETVDIEASTVSVAQVGAAGAAYYSYQAVPVRADGEKARPGRQQTTSGNATLSGSNLNRLTLATTGSATSSFSKTGSVVTLTAALRADLHYPFTVDMLGWQITVAGSTTPGNDGTFTITQVVSATVVKYTNASGATEAAAGTWVLKPHHHDIYRCGSPDGTGLGKIGSPTTSTFDDTGNSLLPGDGTQAPWESCGLWLVNGSDNVAGSNGGYTNVITVRDNWFDLGPNAVGIVDDGGDSHFFEKNGFNGSRYAMYCAGGSTIDISGGYVEGASTMGFDFHFFSFTTADRTSACSNVSVDGVLFSTAALGPAINVVSLGTLVLGLNLFVGGGINNTNVYITGGSSINSVTENSPIGVSVYDAPPPSRYSVPLGGLGGVAELGVANVFTKTQSVTPVVLVSASNATPWNGANGNNAELDLAAESTTVGAMSSAKVGATYYLHVKGATGKTVAFNAVYDFGDFGAPASPANGKVTTIAMYCNATNHFRCSYVGGYAS